MMTATQILEGLRSECRQRGLSDQLDKGNRTLMTIMEGINQLKSRLAEQDTLSSVDNSTQQDDPSVILNHVNGYYTTTHQKRAELLRSFYTLNHKER